jgi:cag pathogenicity island protein 24
MKYSRLTKEQFEELHQEFINFLATQTITASEWADIKKNKPEVAEEELDIFSDLVWEGVLSKAQYLENMSAQQLFLFQVEENQMSLISLKVNKEEIDITTPDGYAWLQKNYMDDSVEFFTSEKGFSKDKHQDIFGIIKQGAVMTKGSLFQFFERFVG